MGIDYVYRQWPKNEKLVLTGNNAKKKKVREEMKVNENNRNNVENNNNKKNTKNSTNHSNAGKNQNPKQKVRSFGTNAYNDFSDDEFSPPPPFQSFIKTSKLPAFYSNYH